MNRRGLLGRALSLAAIAVAPAPRGPISDPAPLPFAPKPIPRTVMKIGYAMPISNEYLEDVLAFKRRLDASYFGELEDACDDDPGGQHFPGCGCVS